MPRGCKSCANSRRACKRWGKFDFAVWSRWFSGITSFMLNQHPINLGKISLFGKNPSSPFVRGLVRPCALATSNMLELGQSRLRRKQGNAAMSIEWILIPAKHILLWLLIRKRTAQNMCKFFSKPLRSNTDLAAKLTHSGCDMLLSVANLSW